MANYNGFLVEETPLYTRDYYHLSTQLDTFSVDYWPPHASKASVGGSNIYIFKEALVEVKQSLSSELAPSFKDNYYERIHILPNPVALGNLLSDQTRQVEVWNAYTKDSQLLNSITGANDSGLVLTEPATSPVTYRPLESMIYTLSISLKGPPTIDATYTFDFPNEDPILSVTGTRVVSFTFMPDWGKDYKEKLEWLNELLLTESGREQVISLRKYARRYFDYRFTVKGSDKQYFENILWAWQARKFAIPIWYDETLLTTAAVTGDTTLSLDTQYRDFRDNGLALLYAAPTIFEVVEIVTVSTSSLTISLGVQNDWPVGTKVYPLRFARLKDTQQIALPSPDITEALVQFLVTDNATPIVPSELSADTYQGYPVLEVVPNWREKITHQYERRIREFDSQVYEAYRDDVQGISRELLDFHWTRPSRTEHYVFRQWLYKREGRRYPIWVYSNAIDFTLVDVLPSTSTGMKVQNTKYSVFVAEAIGKRDIRIELWDGSVYYRRITGSSEQDKDVEVLQLDSSLPVTIYPSDVKKISFMTLCRMNADSVELDWKSPEIMECSHQLKGVVNDI